MSRPRLPEIASPGAILAILAFINLINYMDRQIIGPLVPLLKAPVSEGGLALSKTELGLLQTAFMIVHSLASIPLGVLADRYMRKKLIAIGVGAWSVATALAGFAQSFAQMFVARGAVGVGEATYAPAASALISDTFAPAQRARALGTFQVGMMLGGALALIAGGQIGGRYGWRAAFFVVGVPGLVLTLLALMIRERAGERGRHAPAAGDPHASLAGASIHLEARALFRSPSVVWINVAGILITFFVGALVFWAPEFILHYHYADDRALLKTVSTTFGAVALPAVLLGTLTGAFVADRLEKTRPGEGRLRAIAIGVLCSAPLALVGVWVQDRTLLYASMGLGVFFNSWYVGPILAALHDVVPPDKRGTATGVYLLLVHLLGDAISPTVVGFVADLSSLRLGLSLAVVMLALGALAALRALPHSRELAKLKRRRETT